MVEFAYFVLKELDKDDIERREAIQRVVRDYISQELNSAFKAPTIPKTQAERVIRQFGTFIEKALLEIGQQHKVKVSKIIGEEHQNINGNLMLQVSDLRKGLANLGAITEQKNQLEQQRMALEQQIQGLLQQTAMTQQLLQQNTDLRQQCDQANAYLAQMEQIINQKDGEIQTLRTQLGGIQNEHNAVIDMLKKDFQQKLASTEQYWKLKVAEAEIRSKSPTATPPSSP